jgi:glyoxylase-like metal-dependent hydrolase (beta-lactamase superfamily II)
MQLAPGLHRIGDDIVAAYLVVAPEGVTIVDAGMAGHHRDLLAELASIGRSVADVRGIVLTHGDGDHVGFAERLRRDHGVPVFVHEADADRAKGGAKPATGRERMRVGAVLGFALAALRKGGLRTTPLTAVSTVRDGDVLDLPGSPRIVGMPGHSPGSVAVHVPLVDAVMVGDALTTRNVLTGRRGPAPAPFTDDPAAALASLRALLPTGARWVLPGHGAPWGEGVASAVEAVERAAGAGPA